MFPFRHIARSTVMLAVALALASPSTAFGTPGDLAAKQAEAAAVREELDRLAVQVETAGEDLAEVEAGLADTRSRIDRTNADIAAAEQDLAVAQETMRERAAASYRLGEQSYLTVLFGSTTFSDLVTRFDFVSRLVERDVEAIDAVEHAQRVLAEHKWSLTQRESEQERLQSDAAAKKRDLDAAVSRQQARLGAIDGEIARILEDERRRQAEAAAAQAQAAAEAAAAQAAAQEEARPSVENEPAAERSQDPIPAPSDHGRPVPSEPPAIPAPVTPPTATESEPSAPAPAPTRPAPKPAAGSPGAPRTGVIAAAQKYLGVPYVWGGASMTGLDCSGFTMLAYRDIGISLPHQSRLQFAQYASTFIPPERSDQLQPGDLVFWGTNGDPSRIYHVGIYAGGGSYIHAPQAGDVVRYATLRTSSSSYVGAVRP